MENGNGNTAIVKREEFGAQQLAAMQETASVAVAAQAKAAVESRYIMALRKPRDMDDVRIRMLKECARPGFAEAAWYRKPVGKGVEGFSVRFAEAAIRCMSNVMPEVSTVYDDREKRIVRVSVTDLESNVTYSRDVTVTKTVERSKVADGQEVFGSRQNSQGKTTYIVAATEDDLLNKEGSLVSKALRNLALRLVPGDILDECEAKIKAVRRKGDAEDPEASRKKLADAFAALGIMPADLKAYLGQALDSISPAQLAELRDLYSAIKTGETTWREVMSERAENAEIQAAEPAKSAKEGLKARVKEQAKGKPSDLRYLETAHQAALELVRQGQEGGWLSAEAAESYRADITAAREVSATPRLRSIVERIEGLQPAAGERDPGAEG